MNIEECALVKAALEATRVPDPDQAAKLLRQALEVRPVLKVCEKCLKIGGCEHVKSGKT